MLTRIENWQLKTWVENDLCARMDRMKASRADAYRRFDAAWDIGDHAAADALDQLGHRLFEKINELHKQLPRWD